MIQRNRIRDRALQVLEDPRAGNEDPDFLSRPSLVLADFQKHSEEEGEEEGQEGREEEDEEFAELAEVWDVEDVEGEEGD